MVEARLHTASWQETWSSLRMRCRRVYSSRSNQSLPSFRLVLNHNRSFFASCAAAKVRWEDEEREEEGGEEGGEEGSRGGARRA